MQKAIQLLEQCLVEMKKGLPNGDKDAGNWDESLSKEDGSQKAASQESSDKSDKKKMVMAAMKKV